MPVIFYHGCVFPNFLFLIIFTITAIAIMMIVVINAKTPISISTKNTEDRIARKNNIIVFLFEEIKFWILFVYES